MCMHIFCHCSFSLAQARESYSCQALPSHPQIRTKVQLGIMGWGAQITLLCSISLRWANTRPCLQGGGGMGLVMLKKEGDQCSNLPGPPPSLSGSVQWVWGFPPRVRGLG